MLDIWWIHSKIQNGEYYFSRHGDKERQNDNLAITEVEEALLNGTVLEKYEDTGRGTSCLIAGLTNIGKPIHIRTSSGKFKSGSSNCFMLAFF